MALDRGHANTDSPEDLLKDAEKQQSVDNGRRGSRISGVARRDMDDSDDASLSIGKQIELESGNAIKYRTCSWQKVRFVICGSLHLHVADSQSRLQPCCSPSTSAWPSCLSHGLIPFLDWYLVLS